VAASGRMSSPYFIQGLLWMRMNRGARVLAFPGAFQEAGSGDVGAGSAMAQIDPRFARVVHR
jgi:hypothetical protein